MDCRVAHLLVVLSIAGSRVCVAQPANSPWPMGGHDAQRTSATTLAGPTTAQLLWKVPLPSSGFSLPSIGADGSIYVANSFGRLYSVSPQGQINWVFNGSGSGACTPAVASSGAIYYGSGRNIYAVAPNGSQLWNFDAGVGSSGSWVYSPSIAPDGNIDVGTFNGQYRLSPSGTLVYHYSTASNGPSALMPDGSVIQNAQAGSVIAFRRITTSGTQQWVRNLSGSTRGPIIGPGSSVYGMDYDGHLYSLNPATGTSITLTTDPINGVANLSVDPLGNIYAGRDDRIEKFSSTGQLLWSYLGTGPQGTGGRSGSPVIDVSGNVFCADGQVGDSLHALASDGVPIWSFASEESGYHFTSPIIGAGGVLYATSWSYADSTAYLYAIVPSPGTLSICSLFGVFCSRRRRSR